MYLRKSKRAMNFLANCTCFIIEVSLHDIEKKKNPTPRKNFQKNYFS